MSKSSKTSKDHNRFLDWKQVGRRIRELRGFDMTQEEFAARIGVTQGYLSSMEHGKKEVSAEILLRISQEFERSVDWLLTGDHSGVWEVD